MAKRTSTFQENIRYQFMLYTFIPIILLMLVMLSFFIYSSGDCIRKTTVRTAADVEQLLANEFQSYEEFALQMAASPQVIAYMAEQGRAQEIFQEFYNFNKGRLLQSDFHIYDEQGQLLLSSAALSKASEETLNLFVLPRIRKQEGKLFWETDQLIYQNQESSVYVISVDVKTYGYVVFTLKENDFFELLDSIDNEVCLITDLFDNVIVSNNRRFVNSYNKAVSELTASEVVFKINETKYFKQMAELNNYPLRIYAANAITPTEERIYSVITVCIVMITVFLVLLWFLSYKIAKRTSSLIKTMIDAVSHTRKGELDYRVDINTNDEFQTLGEQFNKMQKQIKILLHNNEELVNLRREAEVKQLESQFNPHFIFNVLESIRYSVYFDQKTSIQIVESLSRLLKYSINTSEAENMLVGDFRYLEEFLKLHKFRLGEKMNFQVKLPEELESVKVPKLILQPIVENSLKYGYCRHNAISIDICVAEENGWLKIVVSDDGGGISKDVLREIETCLHSSQMPGEHTGLYSSNKRLKLMYGEGSGLTLINQEGVSFTVIVQLPIRR